ncbi:MAG: UxaA family hydrolase, partial [Armatimonadota bacterium]
MKFRGYRRPEGTVGVRNHVLVLPTVACSVTTALRIAAQLQDGQAVAISHAAGCAQTGPDLEQTNRTLVGLATNPNVHSVLVVGLGCESVPLRRVADAIADSDRRVEVLLIQEHGGSRRTAARGVSILEEMIEEADRQERVECSIGELVVATQCGGSDAWSGVSANPGVGEAADVIVRAGGTVILGETTEMIGAEHLLVARAANPSVASEIQDMVGRTERTLRQAGYDPRSSNPSPGNIQGGITTLEEKSLGAICKGGSTPVQQVLQYAEKPTASGLVLMDTPGEDVTSLSGMVAAGAQVVL